MLKLFRRIRVNNRELDQVQTNVAQILNPISAIALLDGVLIQDVAVSTSTTSIEHKLGRQPLGWILVDNQAAATVHRTSWDARYLTLDASSATTISVWVF